MAPPRLRRKVIEDEDETPMKDEEEPSSQPSPSPPLTSPSSSALGEEKRKKKQIKPSEEKGLKKNKGGMKRKVIESSSDDDSSSDDELDERLELTTYNDDDIESFSTLDSQCGDQLEDDDEETEEEMIPHQYEKLLESKFASIKNLLTFIQVEKAILGKLEGHSSGDHQQLIIHSIEMKNFKSYKDTTLVGPFTTGLNCIIGSNGSGKSNIIDSICFVLGFESKELRAKNLDYLINDQSSVDDETYVKINFCVLNTTGGNDSTTTQFSVQRKIKKNDHSSSYFLFSPTQNEGAPKRISKKQVRELLNGYGIDFDYPDRFIVMQHNTIKMVKQNPLEMLFHLEKLFGTEKVQIEIKQLQEDITNLQSDIQSHEKQKSDCEGNLESLKPTVETFQNFQRLEKKVEETKALIKDCELKCLLFNLDKTKKELKSVCSELSELENDQSNTKQQVKKNGEEIEKQVAAIETIESEIEIYKKNTSKVQKTLLKLRLVNDSHNQKVKHLEGEMERISKQSNQLSGEKSELEKSIVQSDETIQELEKSIAVEEDEINRLTSKIDVTSQKLLIELREELQELEESSQYLSFTSRIEKSIILEAKIDSLNTSLADKEAEKKEVQILLNENSKLKKLADSEIDNLKSNFQKLQYSIDSNLQERNRIEDEIIELETASLQRDESNSLFLNTIGRAKSEIEGCFGTIPEIYKIIDQKYSICANSVFLPYLKNTVVVASREVALNVVGIFERNRSGLVSCEILDEIKQNNIGDGDALTPKELKPLIEVLDCESQYRKLLIKHTNGWFIADSIENAMKYSFHNGIRRNVVTMDGKVFKSFGEISCHFSKDQHQTLNQQLLTTHYRAATLKVVGYNCKENELRLSNLKEKTQDLQVLTDQLLISLDGVKQQISEREVVSRNYQSTLKKLESSQSALSRKINTNRKEIEHQRESLNSHHLSPLEEAAFEKVKEKKQQLEMKISEIESTDDGGGDGHNGGNSLSKIKQSSTLKQKECTNMKLFKESQRKKLNHITTELASLTARKEKCSSALDQCMQDDCGDVEELDSLETEYASLKKQKEKLELKKHNQCESLKDLKRSLKKLVQIIDNNDQQISKHHHEKGKFESEMEELKLAISKVSSSSSSDRSKMKVDTKLDIVMEEKRKLKLLSELKYTSAEMENLQDNVDRECMHKQSTIKKNLNTINKRLNSINQKIEKLEQLESKFLTLRYDLFHKVISKVNENLSQIFRELNNNSNCYISYYEDKKTLFEKGVNIYCKYDMEWKEFGKLSGGQKNLVCSVLSVALMRCFSTSFCIFDELCSSLDTINVEKLAKLIKCSSIKTQFICISFKFYEKADTIIGVYHKNGISCTVSFSNK